MVEQFDVMIPDLSGNVPRKVYVYLPLGYEAQKDTRYPVLYMFDGQDIFFDSTAAHGLCWGMKDYLDRTRSKVIVAAVENNRQGQRRLNEYTPVRCAADDIGIIEPQGQATMEWLTGTLKPLIDARFRTLPDRLHTAVGGSSMGGLMALYAVTAYHSVFSMAAALSPSLWLGGEPFFGLLCRAPLLPETNIYMDYGSRELHNRAQTLPRFEAAAGLFLRQGVGLTARIFPGGEHNVAAWAQRVPDFMQILRLGL